MIGARTSTDAHAPRLLCRARRILRSAGTTLRADAGTMTILTTGILVVVLMVIGVGVAITGVHLERNALQDAADGAALAGSQSIDEDSLYQPGAQAVTTPGEARSAAEDFLRRYPLDAQRIREARITEVSVAVDGTVAVTLTGLVDPPLIGWITNGADISIPVTTQGEARAR